MLTAAKDKLTIGRASKIHLMQSYFINLAVHGGVWFGWINDLTCP
jgi:hypothetical protein